MRYRNTYTVEAYQWFKNGDHPDDNCTRIYPYQLPTPDGLIDNSFLSEGKVVRYYRHPQVSGKSICKYCGITMHEHGWIDTGEHGYTVCPGDWIIKGFDGIYYPCKPDVFALLYEPCE